MLYRVGVTTSNAVLGLLPLIVGVGCAAAIMPSEEHGRDFFRTRVMPLNPQREDIPAHRGLITDRHGEPLAIIFRSYDCQSPAGKQASAADIEKLAAALNMPVSQLQVA